MNRQETNIVLLKTLEMLIEKYPDMRFGQILFNFGFIDHIYDKVCDVITIKDPFSEEPSETLKRVEEEINRLINA
jgi:hypothetical protein